MAAIASGHVARPGCLDEALQHMGEVVMPQQREASVEDVIGQRSTVVCVREATLSDAVDLMSLYDRTSAGVVCDDGKLVGVLTENDIVRAYVEGVSSQVLVGEWLQSGRARLPSGWMQSEAVLPSTPLLEAAVRMRAHAITNAACHHLLVLEPDGLLRGILSSLDLARAMCRSDCPSKVLRKIHDMPVEAAMKPRMKIPTCSLKASLGQVLQVMDSVHQNCVLISDGQSEHAKIYGMVTPRDALRAFVEHLPLNVDVAHWLRGLKPEWKFRLVNVGTSLSEAAGLMAAASVHHLVVYSPAASEVVGVISTSDLVQAIVATEDIFMMG